MLHDPKKEARIAEEIFEAGLEPWQRFYLDAAEIIKSGGWTRNSYYNQHGHCAVGALARVVTGVPNLLGTIPTRVLSPLATHVDLVAHEHLEDLDYLIAAVVGWNDAHSIYGGTTRTKAEVVRTLQLVALG